ncbi:Transcriptional regulator, contains XRE-family HTH domain [Acetoanaerobium noterae]|uniref:Transcriptional regulator, contains XRE-family HTH domain n=2 Tax=root TaxID=1 RepID=A0A1T5C691_9FIRM|nr:helix-turn-helix transcriptional regulator [Acetoanaerobium noterae]SKB55102.1 Transcriptional regulator, contains XRE-family HTH domain [Acetoanaerobium noterae]
MILADKIILLRKKSGWSQEDLAEKLNVSRQSISKWEGAQSVPGMDKILQLSEIFGVSTDYLLKDSIELEEYVEQESKSEESSVRYVSMEEANSYLDLTQNIAHKMALGVAMCIMSPAIIITLSNLYLFEQFSFSENQSQAIALTLFFITIASAVVIFISIGMKFKDFEYLKTEPIETEYGVSGMVKSKMKAYKETYSKYNIIGVTLCILSVLPVILSSFADKDLTDGIGVIGTLFMVAVGVFMLVTVGTIWSSFNVLLQEGEYSVEGKAKSKVVGSIAGIYWLLTTALYLFISFYYGAWDKSWMIWPVAGVLFGAVAAIANLVIKSKK